MYHNDTNKMAAHVKRDAVRDYFVVNVADGSCRVCMKLSSLELLLYAT